MKRFWRQVPIFDAAWAAARSHLLYAFFFSALLNLLFIAPMLYMLQIYDRVLPTNGKTTLLFITLVLLFALATLSLLDSVRMRLLARASLRLDRVFSGAIMEATLKRPEISSQRIAKQALREFDVLRQVLTGPAIVSLFDAPWVPVYVLVAFLIHPWIGALAFVGAMLNLLLAWSNEKATSKPLSRSALAGVEARLAASEENYRRVIGRKPDALAPPPPLPPLPSTPEEAVRIALASNPDLIAINRAARAAGYDIGVASASRLPTLSAIGSGRYTNYLGTADDQFAPGAPNSTTATGAGVQARIPLYQGGLPAARVRQAQAAEQQLLEQAVGTERSVVANARSAFASYEAARRAIESNQVAVQANELALEGARAEQSVGTRTVLEVLNAEQELLNSQVALVTAKRDAYVAGFQLLNAMGQAEARDLGLEGGPLYDPLGNYRRVSGAWSDWANDPRRSGTAATRTVEEPAAPPQR